MAARPEWLSRLSKSFKAHRKGRTGWNVEVMRERLRIVSAELPPRPDEPADATPKRRSLTLSTPPGPSYGTEALAEACAVYDAVAAGTWKWPDPDGLDPSDEKSLFPPSLERLVERLKEGIIGESIVETTWKGTYAGYFAKLIEVAGTQRWNNDEGLLEATLKHWKPNSRARQIAHDRFRRLWKEAGWSWPQSISPMRGNGKAAAPTDGVRAFKNEETTALRQRIKRSKLSQSAAIAWDLLAAFGIRPAELKGISLKNKGGQLIATVHREKTTLKGKENFREVPAAPPEDWPDDCHDLLKRFQKFGLDPGLVALRAPSDRLAKQLDRLKKSETITCEISQELTAYGLRHAFAIRLAELGLNYREAAALMGHDPATHIAIYGKRLESPKLIDKVRRARKAQSAASHPADTSEN